MSKRISIKYRKQDAWIGVYWTLETIYICLIPCFPIVIKRTANCEYCKKKIKGVYAKWGYQFHDGVENIKYSKHSIKLVTCRKAQQIDDIAEEECS